MKKSNAIKVTTQINDIKKILRMEFKGDGSCTGGEVKVFYFRLGGCVMEGWYDQDSGLLDL